MPASPHDYAASGVVRRSMRLLVTSRPVARLSALFLPGLDRVLFRITGGRLTFSAWVTGLPVLVMTTTGARTGQPRSARVLGIPDGDGFIVVAANFGQRTNPAWYHNLLAHPAVTVTAPDSEAVYHARELSGAERDRGFRRALALNPGWRRFQRQAGDREIPVFRLEPSPPPS